MHTYDINCMIDRTDNNASECFNNWILLYRDKSCLTMLEEIICRLMKRFTKRRNEAATWKWQLTPKVLRELGKKRKLAQKMIVQASGELNFQVMDAAYNPPRRFIVKLETRTCDCGYWEIAASLVNMRWLPLDMQDTELRSMFQHGLLDKLTSIHIQWCLAPFGINAHGSVQEDHWLIYQLCRKKLECLKNPKNEQKMSLKKRKEFFLLFARFAVAPTII